jgi:hypothetical protein
VRAVGWSPAYAGERASAQADAQRKRLPAPISIGKFSSVVAGACAHKQFLRKYPRLKSLRASRWLVACLRRRARVRAGGRSAETLASADFNRQIFIRRGGRVMPMNNSFQNIRD